MSKFRLWSRGGLILIPVLALLAQLGVSAAPRAAADTPPAPPPSTTLTARGEVPLLWQDGGAQVKVAAEQVLPGSDADVSSFLTTNPPALDPAQAIVEDYSYPGADTVLTQRGIKLIKGDGHIVLADCGANPDVPPADLILVQSLKPDFPAGPNFCFKATGAAGYLTMEIPDVYFVRGDNGRTIAAKVETHDNPTVVETEKVEPGEWQAVGVGQSRGSATILELRYPFGS